MYTTSISKLANFDIEVPQYRVRYSIPVHFDIEAFKLRYQSASIQGTIFNKCALISKYSNIDIEVHTLRYRSPQILTPDIEACRLDIEETSISKFFGSFDIEVLNFYVEVLDFDIEVLRSTSKYFDIKAYFNIGGGKVPDVKLLLTTLSSFALHCRNWP